MTGFRNAMMGAAGAAGAGGFAVDNSMMLNDGDSEYLSRTPGTASSTRLQTLSVWCKRGNLAQTSYDQYIFAAENNEDSLAFHTDGTLRYAFEGFLYSGKTEAVFRDPHAWYHVVMRIDTTQATSTDRVRIYVNGVVQTLVQGNSPRDIYPGQNYDLTRWGNSSYTHRIGWNGAANKYYDGYMAEFALCDGQSLAPTSFAEYDTNGVWRPKDFKADVTFGNNGFYLPFNSAAGTWGLGADASTVTTASAIQQNLETGNNETNNGDMSGTAAGIKYTAVKSGQIPSIQIRTSSTGMSGVTCQVKQDGGTGQSPSGSVLTNGEVTGVSQSGAGYATFTFPNGGPTVTAGTTYWFMIPSDTGTWGIARDNDNSEGSPGGRISSSDGSYNTGSFGHKIFHAGNHFIPVNSPTQTTDTCTNNAATLSPLWTDTTLSNGNLKAVATGNSYQWAISTIAIPSSGKWTFEAQSSNIDGSSKYGYVGLCQMGNHNVKTGNNYIYGINAGSGEVVKNSSALVDVGASPLTSLMRIEYDADNDTIKIFDDDTEVFPASTGVSNTVGLTGQNSLHFFVAPYGSGADFTVTFKGLSDTPTSGYLELNTTNLLTNSTPTIEDGSAYFQATAYSGTGSAREVNQSGNSQFQPDLVWVKKRNGANEHRLVDAVRGATKTLFSDGTAAESTEATGVTGFDSDGFSVGTGGGYNNSSGTYVGWQWLAGNSTASNSNGSITSTVSVNQTAGFSIVKYTGNATVGATVGHGLGAVPSWIVIKPTGVAEGWANYHVGIGNTAGVYWNSTMAKDTGDYYWNDTTPSSSVFTLHDHPLNNGSGNEMIAYCWCEKPGFSRFGSYEGNVSDDGIFIELGFKPSFFIAKNIDSTGAWLMFDSAREPFNLMDLPLEADDSKAEAASGGRELDFLSNGVKLRGNSSYLNSAHTFIYMAFAEHPFAGTTPATAR